jgi:type IV pilus assembly protein PilM
MMNIQGLFQNGGGPVPSCRAIEIGTSSVRAAALKRGGRIPRLTDYREVSIPREKPGPAPAETVGEKLRALVRGMRLREEVITTALPLHLTFIRLLEVPFTKVAQIRQVIASEAELHVPFPLEEVIIDFWPVEELPEGKSRVMMAAVKKSVLAEHLRLLSEAGINPGRVNLDILGSCRTVIGSSLIDPGEVTMLLDIGAGHSGAAFILGGGVFFVRSIFWGGDAVTSAIAEASGSSFAAAEDLKISSAREVLEEIFSAAYNQLEVELLRTLPAAAAAAADRSPANLVLTGGGSQSPGLGEYLAAKTGLKLLEIDPGSAVRSRRRSPGPGAAAAIGLALSEITSTRDRIDLRREEFAFAGAWKKLRRRLLITVFLTAGVLALLALGFFWKIGMEKREIRNLDRRIRQVVRLTFPEAPVPVPGQELRVMEGELEKAGQELKYYRALVSTSALDILREISRAVPEAIRVQVVVMDIDDNRVIFRGRTNNYRSAELIKNALSQSDYFQGDKIRETRDSKTLQKGGELVTVEFEYLLPLAPREGGETGPGRD